MRISVAARMIAFWILSPIMVLAALGLLFVRKAVHAALLLAVVMIGLAILYLVQDAPFLFATQIIVYTGAILMLFLCIAASSFALLRLRKLEPAMVFR